MSSAGETKTMLHTIAMGTLPPTGPMPSVCTKLDTPAIKNEDATRMAVSAGPNPSPTETSNGYGSD